MEYYKCEAWLLQRTRLDEEGAIFQLVLQLAKKQTNGVQLLNINSYRYCDLCLPNAGLFYL